MKNLKTLDISEYLNNEKEIASYLQEVLEENNLDLLKLALDDIVKARGMTSVAKQIGVNRQSLYVSLSDKGNPAFTTIQKLISSFGLKLTVTVANLN